MNIYLSKLLNENNKNQVNTLLKYNIITPIELKDQVIISNNGSYIYYGALAIYNSTNLNDTKSILEELREVLFSLNDYPYILHFMRNIKISNIETYLNKLIEASNLEVLIETLNFITYINSNYLNEEKRNFFIEAIIKKLISLKEYSSLFRYLHNKSQDICYIAINNGDKNFLTAYYKYLLYAYKNFGYEEHFKKYMALVKERYTKLSLEDNSLTPNETLDFFQSLVEKKDYETIKEYSTNFHDLFTNEPTKTR